MLARTIQGLPIKMLRTMDSVNSEQRDYNYIIYGASDFVPSIIES